MRLLLGFPDELYEEYFKPPDGSKGETNPYGTCTELYMEMEATAARRLPSMKAWGKIPWWERRLWIYFWLLRDKKVEFQHKQDEVKRKQQAEMDRRLQDPPAVAHVPRARLKG